MLLNHFNITSLKNLKMSNGNYRLYDAFGELLYVLAMSDGEIQQEERETLEEILENHPWAREIKWSFDYESKRDGDLEDTFHNVFLVCSDIGPNPEYQFMLEVLEKVAESSLGIDDDERRVIDKFKHDLTEEFRNRS